MHRIITATLAVIVLVLLALGLRMRAQLEAMSAELEQERARSKAVGELVQSMLSLPAQLTPESSDAFLLANLTRDGDERDYAKLAPYAGLRWDGDRPLVLVDGTWYVLESIDGVGAAEISRYCTVTYRDRARKRFGEDLVEVMTRMGRAPGETVTLRLRDPAGGETFDRADVPMTEANRRAIWQANRDLREVAPPAALPGIERDHADRIDERFGHLTERPNEHVRWRAERLTAAEAAADLDELEAHLRDRFSYLELGGVDVAAALDTIRAGLGEGIRVDDLAIQLQRLLALFGDGHAGVRGLEGYLGPGYASCLFGDTGDRIVAFEPDRSGFVIDELPYVNDIDHVSIDRWLEGAATIVTSGSPQLVRRRAVRNLRYLPFLGRVIDRDVAGHMIHVESDDAVRAAFAQLPIDSTKPLYGTWPRTESRRLDGNVGYLRLADMDGTAAGHVRDMMAEFADTDGLIIDVRGNGGGTREPLQALLPFLLPADAPPRVVSVAAYRLSDAFARDHLAARFMYRGDDALWSDRERETIVRFAAGFDPEWTPPEGAFSAWHYMVVDRAAHPDVPHYDRPVVVLVNEDCFSATDVFLGALKGVPGVTLIGTASGGGSGRATSVTLRNGGIRVRISSMASFRPDGRLYDGRGIEPDVEVWPDAGYFIGRSDPQLDAAIEHVKRAAED